MSERPGWIRTFTGRQFWPLNPRAEDICIEDIAHALGMKCRYGGHPSKFYSVAEHCVHVSHYLRPEHQFTGLMHDWPEAYSPFGDVPRPIKLLIPFIAEFEEKLWTVGAPLFGLPHEEPCEVKHIDSRICTDEKRRLMKSASAFDPSLPAQLQPLGVTIECWSPERAKAEFLKRYYKLIPA